MKIRILGCSGGIGANRHTTSMLVDDDVLIDAGTGVTKLPLEALAKINHVFVTHAHLDHIATLPMLVDSVAQLRQEPIVVHALAETLDAMRRHVFNWLIWPDFTELPSPERPMLVFQPIVLGDVVPLPGGRRVRPLPAVHQVPAVGYLVENADGGFAFSGDTAECPELLTALAAVPNLQSLVIEAAFADREESLARRAGHLTPARLKRMLADLTPGVTVYVTHLKPADATAIAAEVRTQGFQLLEHDQVIEIVAC